MDIQFINITSFIGISSNAEHFYATVGDPKYLQENLLTIVGMDMSSGVSFNDNHKVKYHPNEQEAIQLWQKDHGHDKNPVTLKWKEDTIKEYMEDGTYRFPSVLAVVRRARELFPKSILCFSMNSSRNQFAKYITKLYENNKKLADEIIETAMNQ